MKPRPFSTPIGAPLVPEFPIRFRQTTILSVLYRSDPEAMAAFLPPPLRAASDRVLLHFYDMGDPEWFGPHQEFAVQIDATLPAGEPLPKGEPLAGKPSPGRKAKGGEAPKAAPLRGAYSPLIMLSTDGGLATGREVYGQPKKLGRPRIEVRGDLIVGVAERNGIEVATATVPYKQRRAEIGELTALVPFATNLNYKVIPRIDGGSALRQITARVLQNVTVHECWGSEATVELRPNAQFPLHRLPVLAVEGGWFWRADFTLPFGQVVFDEG